jgi:hypothetical protein
LGRGAAAALLVAAAVGCRDHRAGGAASDGGAGDAAPRVATADGGGGDASARASADRTLRVVAQAPTPNVTLGALGERVVLAVGPLVYEGKEDGELALVGGAQAYAPLYPDEESLVGYGPVLPRTTALADDGHGGLVAEHVSPKRKTWRLAGAKLEAVDAKPFFRAVPFRGKMLAVRRDPSEVGWLDGSKDPLPAGLAGVTVHDVALAKNGALVAIAEAQKDRTLHALTLRADAPPDQAFADAKLETEVGAACDFVPSFDGETYVRCASPAKAKATARRTKIHRLEGAEWREAFAGALPDEADGPASIDREGALWLAAKRGPTVDRCPRAGRCAPYDAWDKTIAGRELATYVRTPTDAMDANAERYWETISIGTTTAAPKTPPSIAQMIVRGADDAWMVLTSGPAQLVVHSGAPREPAQLPGDVDARVIVRNARPPARWVGHCEHVFVRMAGKRGDERLDLEAAKARLADVKAALAPPPRRDDDSYYGAPFSWAMVEGTLHDEHVVGVVVVRNDVEASLDAMERSVQRLVDKLATDPVSKPLATCTLPVLRARIGGP